MEEIEYYCGHTMYIGDNQSLGFIIISVVFVVGPGPLYIKAFALRGTLYTLISKVDEAVHDLTQVINSDDEQASTKVDCILHVPLLKCFEFN